MGRTRTIGEKGPAETPLSYRAAREVARGLRAKGWAASARFCQGRTPVEIAKVLCGPAAPYMAAGLAVTIAELAGLMPAEAVQG